MLFLAIKHLIARKNQTLLTFLGILLGSASYVTISGFFLGFQGFLLDQLVNNNAHIQITQKEKILQDHDLDQAFFQNTYTHVFWASPPAGRKDTNQIDNPPEWYQLLKDDKRVLAFSPQLSIQALFRFSKSTLSAQLIGCTSDQVKITNISDSMVEGQFSDLAKGGNRLIVGKGLLEKLGAKVSQTLLVTAGTAQPTPFKVVGSFQTGVKIFDDTQAFGYLSDIQKINQTPNQINKIVIRIHDYTQAANMATTWSQIKEDKIESWDQQSANILSVFKIQNATRYLMIMVILVVAAFGTYNILNMTVNQKRKEIAILRSIGFEPLDMIRLFFYQGFILGILGGFFGLILGYLICLYLQTIPFSGGAMGPGSYLHISLKPSIYMQGMMLALISSSIASILPARAASKMTPIDIIRAGVD